MGRPKDFPALFQDLAVKYKSKAIADREYKTYMLLAREQRLTKDAKLSDIKVTDVVKATGTKRQSEVVHHGREKKLRVTDKPIPTAGVSSSEKELYERLVEAQRLRAEAEKQRGDDLNKIAMMLASGKKEDMVIPPSPAVDEEPAAGAGNIESTPVSNTQREERTKQKHDKLKTLAGVAAGVGGSASKSQSKQKGGGVF